MASTAISLTVLEPVVLRHHGISNNNIILISTVHLLVKAFHIFSLFTVFFHTHTHPVHYKSPPPPTPLWSLYPQLWSIDMLNLLTGKLRASSSDSATSSQKARTWGTRHLERSPDLELLSIIVRSTLHCIAIHPSSCFKLLSA